MSKFEDMQKFIFSVKFGFMMSDDCRELGLMMKDFPDLSVTNGFDKKGFNTQGESNVIKNL